MVFADADSVMQLLVGLNLAYFSFRDIRSPALAAFNHDVSQARSSLDTLSRHVSSQTERLALLRARSHPSLNSWVLADNAEQEYKTIWRSSLGLPTKLSRYEKKSDRGDELFDEIVQRGALLVALVDFLFLIVSAHYAASHLCVAMFDGILGISIIPTALAILSNLRSSTITRREGKGVRELLAEADRLRRVATNANGAVFDVAQQLEREGR